MTEFDFKPFDFSNGTLRTLKSGMIALDRLVCDFETAESDGELLVTEFFEELIFSKFPKTAAMENKPMAQVIALSLRSEEKIDRVQVMEHRVTEECLPIYNINGTMIKVQKSTLVQ